MTPCLEEPADDSIMPAVARVGDQFDDVKDQLFGNTCSDSGAAVQSSGASGFLASDPIEVCDFWKRMDQYGGTVQPRDWCFS